MSEDPGPTERVLLTIASSDGDLPYAVPGLALQLSKAGTVFAPVPATPPDARVAVPVPAVVVVALDDTAAGQAVGEWLTAYLDQYPAATITCTVGDRSVRLDAAQRDSAPEALRKLLDT
jgi:hypothetical protein